MDFSPPPKRGFEGNLLPMINVVFLLLIFFLISAKLAPPEPFPVTPPEAEAQGTANGDFTLYLGADGALGFHDRTSPDAGNDTAVFGLLAEERVAFCLRSDCTKLPPRLFLRADVAAPAARLAAVMAALGQAGFSAADLVIRSADGAEP
ncbi:MAG: biopolymer transporter ExbD [Proteobacteria bacterium]|nr:biopolymer transporter ExbD [Pseudomonadota bacterium]